MPENLPHVYDIVGVGLGPANLSLACLLASGEPQQKGLTSTFLEQGAVIDWHQGQTVLGSTTLSEFFFDLVTPVDPTSRFSFLNFLKENGRLERFL
ncbi:MAG: SidA/IucD/PvdA family monooxygenase, partial [Myxococcota bacterium]